MFYLITYWDQKMKGLSIRDITLPFKTVDDAIAFAERTKKENEGYSITVSNASPSTFFK